MKKALLLSAILFLVATITRAQITKGSVLLGGSINFGSTKTDNSDLNEQSNVYIIPSAGVAVKENLIVGIEVIYNRSKTRPASPLYEYEEERTGGSVFLRRYFPLSKNFYAYGQGNLAYLNIDAESLNGTDSKTEIRSNEVSLTLAPGLAYALSKKFHLEFGFNNMLGLSYGKSKRTDTNFGNLTTLESNSFSVSTGLSTSAPFNLGFRVFLSK